jgi:dephospho-CoA kinase
MKTIGVIGGIASGKSAVAALLAKRGAVVLDADRFAHAALGSADVLTQLVQRFGSAIHNADGSPNRRAIAERVFAGTDAAVNRAFLESLIHPRVRKQMEAELNHLREAGTEVVVLDVPLLIEADWRDLCDWVIFVAAQEEVRRARAAERGWSAVEFAQREAAQLPISKKQSATDVTVENSGGLHELERQVAALWANWRLGDLP